MRVALLLACFAVGGCAHRTVLGGGDASSEISAMLASSAESWNRGDLEGYLDDYLDSEETAFIGSTVTLGKNEVRRRYLESYWKTGKPAQNLSFTELHVRQLGADHAVTRGRYILTDPATGSRVDTGFFTLVLMRTGDGWRILHDHSSAAPLQ